MNRLILLSLIIILGLNCSEPEASTYLQGEWSIKDREVRIFGISAIDQTFLNPSMPIPRTLSFSVPDRIQFKHVKVTRDELFLTIDMVDDLHYPNYRLVVTDAKLNTIGFYLAKSLYTADSVSLTYDILTATLAIDSTSLVNDDKDSIVISGSVTFPHQLLTAGTLTLFETPEPKEFSGISIETFELEDNQSCEVTFHTPVATLPKVGTWSSIDSDLLFVLQDGTLKYHYNLSDDQLTLEDEPEYFSSQITQYMETGYGLLEGTLSNLYSVSSSEYERPLGEVPN